MNNNSIARKNFVWNMVGSTINSFISLFFMIAITRINGIETAGIFTFNFSIACILYIIGVYYGRAYQVTDDKYTNSSFIYNRLFTCLIMMIVAAIIGLVLRQSIFEFLVLIILCLFKALEAFSESLYAIIQKKEMLYKVGISMFLKTIIGFAFFLILDIVTNNLILSLTAILVSYILIIVTYDLRNADKIYLKINNRDNICLLKEGFNTFAFTLLSIFIVNVTKYGMGMQSNELLGIYGIIIMPATIMSLLTQFIIHPYLNKLKSNSSKQDYNGFMKLTYKMIFGTFIIMSMCVIFAILLGIPVLNIIYGVNLEKYLLSFSLIMVGSLFYGLSSLISYILITIRKTLSQLISLIAISIFSIIITYILIVNYSLFGASLAYLIIMSFEFVIYIALLLYYFKKMKCGDFK